MEKQEEEWHRLATAAFDSLKTCQVSKFCEYPSRSLLRLWHYNHLDLHRSWMLLQNDAGNFAVERTTWDRADDASRMLDPKVGIRHPLGQLVQPSINRILIEIQNTDLPALLQDLESCYFSPFQFALQSVETASFGLETYGGTSCRFQWFSAAPKEWAELEKLYHRVLALFESAINPVDDPL